MSDLVPTRKAGPYRMGEGLVWYFDRGYGWHDPRTNGVTPVVYGAEYLASYDLRAETELGRQIIEARIQLLKETVGAPSDQPLKILDYGAGSGAFVREAIACGYDVKGYDINPYSTERLIGQNNFADPRAGPRFDVVCMWDVLEHIEEPEVVLESTRDWLLLALPIFTGPHHARVSKHFRPGEHVWYFTAWGLEGFLSDLGFEFVSMDRRESVLGRESVGTFAFRRREPFRGR